MTFTSSTSKPSGAHTIMSITKHNVCMLTTSKTSDANPISLDTIPSSVKIGSQAPLLLATKKVANVWKNVLLVTDGKNSNSIL